MKSINHVRAEAAKANYLTVLNENPTLSLDALCLKAGIKKSRYFAWRQADDQFRAKVDGLKARLARSAKDAGEDPPQPRRSGFLDFRETFFPHEYPTPKFHMDIVRILESAPPMSVSMILVPPNFGKSTLLEDWVNYRLAQNPNHRITIASKGQQQARKMLGKIQRRMTDINSFPDYISKYGPFKVDGQEKLGKPWTRDYMTVAKADHDERDYSLQVLGWSGQVYGSRIDTLILDDIQTRDNLSSVDDMLDKLSLEFLTRGDDQFRAFIIGTRIEVGDIYERLIDLEVITEGQLYLMPAVSMDPQGEEVSLWPDRWPMDKLNKQRKIVREKAWWCGYMMAPQRGGQATFPEDLMEAAKNHDRGIGVLKPPHLPANTPYLPTALSLDPALGGGNALVAFSYSLDKMWFLDAVRETGLARTEDILLRIEEFARAYRPQDLIIEHNAFQRGLARDDRLQVLGKRYGFTVHEHTTNRNKQDPILGVGSMGGSYSRGEIDIPWGDKYAEERFREFVSEHMAWRADIPTKLLTQDLVMAAWFGWLFWQQKRQFIQADTKYWNRAGLGNSYTQYRPALENAAYL